MTMKSKGPVVLKHAVDDSFKTKPLPAPTGVFPYHLDLSEIVSKVVEHPDYLCFHLVGDTGTVKNSPFRYFVAAEMNRQIQEASFDREKPSFLLHLGDIVYNYGEASAYPDQFFGPYEQYEAPIFALSGNHDADINPEAPIPYQSLDAFMQVFCAVESKEIPFSGGSFRKSMLQPNVYWTLHTPLATILCLYGNATKFGSIGEEQRNWFIAELSAFKAAKEHKALIVCVHQAPYSADTNHGSSVFMIQFLETAYEEVGIRPDLVVSGHVHNYQRFYRSYEEEKGVTYVVAGAGGYADLHGIAEKGNPLVLDSLPVLRKCLLEHYCDDQFGFLKLLIERNGERLCIIGKYYAFAETAVNGREQVKEVDRFCIALNP